MEDLRFKYYIVSMVTEYSNQKVNKEDCWTEWAEPISETPNVVIKKETLIVLQQDLCQQ